MKIGRRPSAAAARRSEGCAATIPAAAAGSRAAAARSGTPWRWAIAVGQVRGQDDIDAEIGELEQVGEQRDVAVRRCGGDALRRSRSSPLAVRPGPQLPPAADQRFLAGDWECDAVPGRCAAQGFALEGIEVAPRGVLADLVHRGLIRAAPVVHAAAQSARRPLRAAADSAMPIRLDRQSTTVPKTSNSRTRKRLHRRQCATPAVGTRSRAIPKCSR